MRLQNSFIINILAFGVFMFAQQIVIMPNILKFYGEDIFADTILIFTLINIFLYITVYSLGNTFLIKVNLYETENKSLGDFNLILLVIILVIISLIFVTGLFFKSIIYCSIIGITSILSVLRVWSEFLYRYENNYKLILLQNLFYLLGSLLIFLNFFKMFCDLPYIYFCLAEIMSLVVYIKKILATVKYLKLSSELNKTFAVFSNVSVQTVMSNVGTYFDRFFLYPVFGAITLNFYYAVTLSSKAIYLFITPINSVLSGYLASVDEKDKTYIFSYIKRVSRKYFIILSIGALIISFVILKFLYSQYFVVGISLLPVIAVSTSLECLIGIYLLVCRRFLDNQKLTVISIVRIILFCLCAFVLGYYFGINGVIYGILLSNIFTFIVYYYFVKHILKCNAS